MTESPAVLISPKFAIDLIKNECEATREERISLDEYLFYILKHMLEIKNFNLQLLHGVSCFSIFRQFGIVGVLAIHDVFREFYTKNSIKLV